MTQSNKSVIKRNGEIDKERNSPTDSSCAGTKSPINVSGGAEKTAERRACGPSQAIVSDGLRAGAC